MENIAKTPIKKQLYRLQLDDYSAASFTSFSKDYFGTLDDIANFISSIREDEYFAKSYTSLFETYEKYIFGDRQVTHNVAYQEVRFLTRVKRLGSAVSYLKSHKWEHLNTWRWPYYMCCSKAESIHLWLSYGGEYARVVQSCFYDLKYGTDAEEYSSFGGMRWGYPHQIEEAENRTFSRLFVIEKTFENKAEVLKDMQSFQSTPDPIFDRVIDDIFGDG